MNIHEQRHENYLCKKNVQSTIVTYYDPLLTLWSASRCGAVIVIVIWHCNLCWDRFQDARGGRLQNARLRNCGFQDARDRDGAFQDAGLFQLWFFFFLFFFWLLLLSFFLLLLGCLAQTGLETKLLTYVDFLRATRKLSKTQKKSCYLPLSATTPVPLVLPILVPPSPLIPRRQRRILPLIHSRHLCRQSTHQLLCQCSSLWRIGLLSCRLWLLPEADRQGSSRGRWH